MQSQLSRYASLAVIPWLLVTPFQFGYHISALNQIQGVLSCKVISETSSCIQMSDAVFSIVTSAFMAGGLVGSLAANFALDKYGRKGCTRINAMFIAAGAAVMTLANSVTLLIIGRMLIGFGAGLGLCVSPVYLNELAPARIKGRVGVFNQMSVVLGILTTQAIGFGVTSRGYWRPALAISAVLSIIQVATARFIVDSPAWLRSVGRDNLAVAAAARVWTNSKLSPTVSADGAAEALLSAEQSIQAPASEPSQPSLGIVAVLKAKELRKPLSIVAWSMFAQQICGINAVLFYSNRILARTLPEAAAFVSLGITGVNALMTIPAIFLIESMGRRNLITLSAAGALASLLMVGFGIDDDRQVMASVAITTFVASFAVGLGPVPFVIIPEVSPFHAVSALSSIGISINWITNFVIGITFLPLGELLSQSNPYQEGRVFYVFAIAFFLSFVAFLRAYRG